MKKRIIIVRSSEVSPDVRVEKIADSLSSMGFAVTVLAWDRSASLPALQARKFGEIRRFGIKAGYGSGLRLSPKLVWFWVMLVAHLLRQHFDAIHACDFDTLPPTLLVSKLKGKRLIYDIFDFYAEGGSVPGALRPAIRFVDKFLMRFASAVIVVDEVRLAGLPRRLRARAEVVYNSPPDLLDQVAGMRFPRVPPKSGAFRIVYSGNLTEGRYIIQLGEAVAGMNDVEMIIAGFGSKEFISRMCDRITGFANVAYIGKNSSFEESLSLASTADAIFSINDPRIPNNKMMSSNKLFEAMMLRKPVVVNRGTSMEDKVTRFQCGLVIDNPSKESLRGAILNLRDNPHRARTMAENGRHAYEQFYRWEQMEAKLAAIYS